MEGGEALYSLMIISVLSEPMSLNYELSTVFLIFFPTYADKMAGGNWYFPFSTHRLEGSSSIFPCFLSRLGSD